MTTTLWLRFSVKRGVGGVPTSTVLQTRKAATGGALFARLASAGQLYTRHAHDIYLHKQNESNEKQTKQNLFKVKLIDQCRCMNKYPIQLNKKKSTEVS